MPRGNSIMFAIYKRQFKWFSRLICSFMMTTFVANSVILPQPSFAQSVLNLPEPGVMLMPSVPFNPAIIKGIIIHPDNPFKFDFIVHPGDSILKGDAFKKESTKLIKYFMAALTIPEDEMWVNLSPYEKNRIIPNEFGDTEMGRDLLAQDYMLKQLTATLMSPENTTGSDFWNRVYKRAYEEYGTSKIPMNTFNKVWIVPEKAMIYESGTSAFIVESHLKVMLEEDYLALDVNANSTKHGLKGVTEENLTELSQLSSTIIREVIIPELEKEVNVGKTFSNLRQITNSVILATWYKQNVQGSILEKIYINHNKTKGVDTQDKDINQKIYNQYVTAFKKGVYNYIKDDYDPVKQEIVSRKYFSGGIRSVVELGKSKDEAALLPIMDGAVKVDVVLGDPDASKTSSSNNLNRRAFLKKAALFAAGTYLFPSTLLEDPQLEEGFKKDMFYRTLSGNGARIMLNKEDPLGNIGSYAGDLEFFRLLPAMPLDELIPLAKQHIKAFSDLLILAQSKNSSVDGVGLLKDFSMLLMSRLPLDIDQAKAQKEYLELINRAKTHDALLIVITKILVQSVEIVTGDPNKVIFEVNFKDIALMLISV